MKKFLILIALLAISTNAYCLSGSGRKTVAVSGTAEAISASSQKFNLLSICAETDNTGTIAVGGSTAIAALATRVGIPLTAGLCYKIDFALRNAGSGNLTEVFIDATTSGDGVTYHWFYVV